MPVKHVSIAMFFGLILTGLSTTLLQADERAYELKSAGALGTTELRFSGGGEFRYMADAATLRECRTGYSYPVLMQGDYAALERAYIAAEKSEPGEALYARVEGHIVNRQVMEGEGPAQSLLVDRFVALQPDMRCERAMSEASLTNTYWRLKTLGNEEVAALDGARESHLVFHASDHRVSGIAGCNRVNGGYRSNGDTLEFLPMASTRMGCPPPLDARERAVFVLFEATSRWLISGQLLEFFDAESERLAVFEAVYLP